jgi:hypothetical protein
MKLISHSAPHPEIHGLLINGGRCIDASRFGPEYDEAFFGGDGLEGLLKCAEANAVAASAVGLNWIQFPG